MCALVGLDGDEFLDRCCAVLHAVRNTADDGLDGNALPLLDQCDANVSWSICNLEDICIVKQEVRQQPFTTCFIPLHHVVRYFPVVGWKQSK